MRRLCGAFVCKCHGRQHKGERGGEYNHVEHFSLSPVNSARSGRTYFPALNYVFFIKLVTKYLDLPDALEVSLPKEVILLVANAPAVKG